MAGIQQPTPAQAAATPSAGSAGDDSDSVDGVSLTGGSSSQAILALSKNLADGAKATTDPTDATGGLKADAPAGSAPGADGNSTAVSAFQAHMSINSHFQQVGGASDAGNSKVSAPIGTSGFNNEVGDKITWMANQGVQSASLQVTPEHLGPVEVRISVQDGSASVTFNAVHPDTRAALEQALPRLREMFATQGLTLSDASVSHQAPRGQQAPKQTISAIGATGGVGDDSTSSTVTSLASSRPGLVDLYA